MAACSSEIDSTVFLRWRQPSPQPAADVEQRRQQLREDFLQHFSGTVGDAQPVATPSKQKRSPKKATNQASTGSDTKAAPRPQQQAARVRPLPRQDQVAAASAADQQAPSPLRHVRLLSPNTRANRWMHTTWHHLPPNPDTSRGNCRASHFSTKTAPGDAGFGHFRIHPDWGWDAPLPTDGAKK